MADPSGEARTAVEKSAAAAAAPPVIPDKQKRQPSVGPVRYNLEAFGVAILGAVLLKWFCLEAFQIPTSSMQPTLMGSSEAGIYDRLLVDKLTPAIRDPQRWDVTVFSYPLQKNQNYVKRLVGLPGETLFIGGGNLYRVTMEGSERRYEVLRKPDDLQEELWKEVFPARLLLQDNRDALKRVFATSFSSAWKQGDEPGDMSVQLEPVPGRTYRLSFRDDENRGFVDQVWDGYPSDVAREIRAATVGYDVEIVPDARIEATFTPEQDIEELRLEVEVRRPNRATLNFALVIGGGTGRLEARRGEDPPSQSAGFVCELPGGVPTRIGFAHVDDQLIAWRDGAEALRFPVDAFDVRQDCELPRERTDDVGHASVPQIELRGRGTVRIEDLRIWRDLHYTKRGFPHVQDLIKIPAGHYFMMGDNTLQSVDSRGWTSISVGVLPDGTVVRPENAEAGGGRVLRGNKRPVPSTKPPDRDETPVVIKSRDMMAMIDEFGEIHALSADARVVDDDMGRHLWIEPPSSRNGDKEWEPPEQWVPFVPREHIRGRALLIFWRWPFPRLSPIR